MHFDLMKDTQIKMKTQELIFTVNSNLIGCSDPPLLASWDKDVLQCIKAFWF